MALRKRLARNIFSDGQQTEENTQEDESADDEDNENEFSSSLLAKSPAREKRQKEKANKPKEMTEEEMMDLALRLSEKEASDVAFQQEQEEEAVMKAIQESMVGETQPCLSSSSKTDRSHRLSCRRKLLYREGLPAADQGAPMDGCTPENDLNSETKEPGDETVSKKRKRSAGSPELEVPVSFQSQDSPCSSESVPAPLHSPQSSDSTQIDDTQLQKSPVFPLTGRNVALQIDRLNQDLVDTCRSSGFVLCSQDSLTVSEKSAQPRSPTFPQSNPTSFSKSSIVSKTVQGEDGEAETNPEFSGKGTSPSACRLPNWENSAFGFSSQDSLTPSVTSFCPKSPVFPRSPNTPNIPLLLDGLSASRSNGRGRRRRNDEPPMSPVFGRTQSVTEVQEKSPNPSAAGCNGEEERICWEMKDPKPDGSPQPSRSEELNEKPKKSAESEPTSEMTLVWSDKDEQDETEQTYFFSPVFPEERDVHQAEHRTASQNHKAAGSPGETRPDSSQETGKRDLELHKHASPSTSTSRLQISTTEEELPPTSRQEAAGSTPPPEESLNRPTVHYYWGVPFCPQGLDPDRYTQVIVAQMEVYEKSLKQAQRVLLRKAEWGEGIEPQPEKSPDRPTPSPQPQVPQRRGLRRRGRKTNEAVEEEERKEEEENEEEEEKKGGAEEQMETDDCDVCPETQLSDDGTQDLIVVTDAAEEKHPELQEGEVMRREDCAIKDELREEEEGGEEMRVVTCTKTKERVSGCSGWTLRDKKEVKEDRRDLGMDMEETKDRGIQRSASPELESAVVPRSPEASVDCPICQASFPVSEIEMHAAYCDGEVAVVEVVTLRRRKRRAGRTAEDTIRNLEKCYICQKAVPLSDYSRHTELCCLRPASRTPARGNLLSALERTEKRDSDAGPSGSKLQPQAVIDLRDDDDDEEEEEAAEFRIRDSPIRTFTSISEATGCLIDFKKQQRSKKPSQKRR